MDLELTNGLKTKAMQEKNCGPAEPHREHGGVGRPRRADAQRPDSSAAALLARRQDSALPQTFPKPYAASTRGEPGGSRTQREAVRQQVGSHVEGEESWGGGGAGEAWRQ